MAAEVAEIKTAGTCVVDLKDEEGDGLEVDNSGDLIVDMFVGEYVLVGNQRGAVVDYIADAVNDLMDLEFELEEEAQVSGSAKPLAGLRE